jgi:hypothetical protein
MTNFYGSELELFATEVLAQGQGLSVQRGVDDSGGLWLIVRVDDNPDHLIWICAPVSPRALSEVAAGRAAVRDALRHSATGTVELVTLERGHARPDSCLLCCDIPSSLLPPGDSHLAPAA